MIGQDDDGDGESLSVHDAGDIWLSSGIDEDYTFGYVQLSSAGVGLDPEPRPLAPSRLSGISGQSHTVHRLLAQHVRSR
jgi:hypothetical protein